MLEATNRSTPQMLFTFAQPEKARVDQFLTLFFQNLVQSVQNAAIRNPDILKQRLFAPFQHDPYSFQFPFSKSESSTSVSKEHCLRPSEVKKQPRLAAHLRSIMQKECHGIDQIKTMRNQIAQKIASHEPTATKGQTIGEISGKSMRAFLKQILQEGEEELLRAQGLAKPCEYTCGVFGSTARDDGGTHPDLDYTFIVEHKTPEAIRYFEKLSQYVADRLYRLGESIPGENYGIHACYGGASPFFQNYGWRHHNPQYTEELLHQINGEAKQLESLYSPTDPIAGFLAQPLHEKLAKDRHLLQNEKLQNHWLHDFYSAAQPQQSRGTAVLIAEPEELAHWAKPGAEKEVRRVAKKLAKKHGISKGKLARQIGNIGDYLDVLSVDESPQKAKLAHRFKNERMRILGGRPSSTTCTVDGPNHQAISFHPKTCQQESFGRMNIANAGSRKHSLPQTGIIDIKKGFWRFPQTLIGTLSEMHGITEMNSFKRIEILEKKGVFSPQLAKELKESYGFLVALRARCQMHYKCELHDVFPTQEAKEAHFQKLEKELGTSIEEKISSVKSQITALNSTYEQAIRQGTDQKELSHYLKTRSKLYDQLEELNENQALKSGLILTTKEKAFFDTKLLPLLQKIEVQTLAYVQKGQWKQFG